MLIQSTPHFSSECDAAAALVAAGSQARFRDVSLQRALESLTGGTPIVVNAGDVTALRLNVDGRLIPAFLIGVADSGEEPLRALRRAVDKLAAAMRDAGAKKVFVDGWDALAIPAEEVLRQLATQLTTALYRFDRYLSAKPAGGEALYVNCAQSEALQEGACLGEAVNIARDLINDIAESMTPQRLADETVALGERFGFEVEILDEAACRALGMNLFLAVSRGSDLPPKLIVMRWKGAEGKPIALVGKGITYDSGGLHIKTSGMESMHYDMNGAGSVIGAMCAIAARKLPVNVVGVVAACENMVDARSYRNGDIIRSMSGKTVYVRNTDAEGRLTMADAITYCARKEHPAEIIEVAGLTGSVCSFFGNVCAAALTRDSDLFDHFAALSPVTGERIWRMPTFPEYEDMLKWPFADLNNAPETCPGITAALFLDAFSEGLPFLHIDYGAMPFTKKGGANGFGVRTLYEYAKSRAEDERRVSE